MAKKVVKKVVKKDVIPQAIITKLKRVKSKFFKEDTIKTVKESYLELYNEDKKKYKDKNWSDMIFHKRALTKLKNKKKSEKLGGAVDKYYGVILGTSKVRDLSQNRRAVIIQAWEDDPQKALDDGIIMIRTSSNPTTGEVEKVPILDETGGIIPRDNKEFFKRKNGTKFKNSNFGNAIARAYRKTVVGICSNLQGVKGIFTHELRDKSVDLEILVNILVKFSGRTTTTEVITMDKNKYIDGELLKEMIENLEDDLEQEIVTEEYANEMKEHYNNLILLTKKGEGEKIETTLFKLSSTKGTAFIKVEDEKEFEAVDFPMINDTKIDINALYKKYYYPFTSDCSNLLKFHTEHRYIDNNPEKINYSEIVSLQNVNLIQINMEASMAGNYTLFVDDESLFNKDTVHLGEAIDAIKLLVPSYINLNFAQDSKLNLIGSPVQFQAQDEERKEIFEIEIDEKGNEVKIPVFGYPLIMVHGIYPIPEYIVEVDTVDLTLDDEIDAENLVSDKKPETEEETEDETEEIKDAIEDIEELEKEIEPKISKKKSIETPEESDKINDEDEVDQDLW